MKCSHLWSALIAVTTSSTLLFGSTTWQAIISNLGTNEIIPVDLPIGGSPEPASSFLGATRPWAVVITPDATKAVVSTAADESSLFLLDLTTQPISEITRVATGSSTMWCALSPDGTKVCGVCQNGTMEVRQTSDLALLRTVPAGTFGDPLTSVVLSPNAPEGYATVYENTIPVFNTESYELITSVDTPATPTCIAVTPDGTELYVNMYSKNAVIAYITTNDRVLHFISGPDNYGSGGIAVSPDGSTVLIIRADSENQKTLAIVDAKTHSYVTSYPIPAGIQDPVLVSLAPDGKKAYLSDAANSGLVAVIDVATGDSTTFSISNSPSSSARFCLITPDQAPTARFTASISGASVSFNASSSSSPVGDVVLYSYDFGDGQKEETSSPTISHTYSTGGTFTVTLQVTNSSGTSTDISFTGQMASNNGGPSAITNQQISVQATAIAKFKGKIHRRHGDRVFLKTWWSKSQIANTEKIPPLCQRQKDCDGQSPS